MVKVALFSTLLVTALWAFGQNQSEYIRFYGKILSNKDTSEVDATIRYEKLPYYDDLGMAKSSETGDFELYLLNENAYSLEIKKVGFLDRKLEIKIEDPDEDGEWMVNYFLEPDPELAEPELITLDNLIFSRASDVISASSYNGLDDLVIWLNRYPSMIIQLEGHTDFAGNEDANMRLSQARVESVKNYLEEKGIKKNRVLTKAFGGTQPLFTERTDEAKAKNRRVEVRVISR